MTIILRWLAIAGVAAAVAACKDKPPAPAVSAPTNATTTEGPVPPPLPEKAVYLRDYYAKVEDCAFDWGHAGRCQAVPLTAPERQLGGQFFGPNYSSALRPESQLAARREALEQGYIADIDQQPSNRALGSAELKN